MLKALIVDEEVDIWFMLSGLLRQNHIQSHFVNTLSAARRSLKKEIPGMIFFDPHFQDVTNAGFIKYVKENYPKTKIVMVKDKDEQSMPGKDVADLCISKPFNAELINKEIKKLL